MEEGLQVGKRMGILLSFIFCCHRFRKFVLMKKLTATLCLTLAVLLGTPLHANAQAVSDEKVKELIIQQSIASYSGRCPCPYNIMSNGRRCGDRSAYSRPGGKSPICYERDIPKSVVERYRRRFNLR